MTDIPRIGLAGDTGLNPDDRLCVALSRAFEVEFVACGEDIPKGLSGMVFRDHEDQRLELRNAAPQTIAYTNTDDTARIRTVRFAAANELDPTFRDCTLTDEAGPTASLAAVLSGETVLVQDEYGPLWCTEIAGTCRHDRVAGAAPRLESGICLKDLFQVRRFLALLPLVSLLSRIVGDRAWVRPSPKAAFLLDDPNLHAPSYGYLDFAAAVASARGTGYHLALATVPLDTWYTSSRAARIFKEGSDAISLLIHGNDHVRYELGRDRPHSAYEQDLAQALRRISTFEARTGVSVSRVMAAPHGRCHENAARALLTTGYEALCISRPFPWLKTPPPDRPLAGWFPAEFVVGGLPVLPRYGISKDRDELRFRAWLGHPLVIYGHHDDLADGLGVLTEIAGYVNGIQTSQWEGLGSIMAGNFWERSLGACWEVLLFTRSTNYTVPADASWLRVRIPAITQARDSSYPVLEISGKRYVLGPHADGLATDMIPCRPGQVLEIRLNSEQSRSPAVISPPPRRLWPVMRRILTETRDRLHPFGARLRA